MDQCLHGRFACHVLQMLPTRQSEIKIYYDHINYKFTTDTRLLFLTWAALVTCRRLCSGLCGKTWHVYTRISMLWALNLAPIHVPNFLICIRVSFLRFTMCTVCGIKRY